ncbi:hypothetical protein AX17_004621 [Amanita inopinata Kibby_2008]|nr:hypothetical protein AX17_004621 [Amanita inopinata Kibby_2008]
MALTDASRPSRKKAQSFRRFLRNSLNFYRVHTLVFTFIPLIFSGIFYASNGEFKVAYIDSLFICISAMTMTGLSTTDPSSLTPWQQAMLFILMCIGSPVVVSWFIVFIRKYYFAKKFKHIIAAAMAHRLPTITVSGPPETGGVRGWWNRIKTHRPLEKQPSEGDGDVHTKSDISRTAGIIRRLTPDMIRRLDAAPRLVNPSGRLSEGRPMPRTTSNQPQLQPHSELDRKLSIMRSATVHAHEPVQLQLPRQVKKLDEWKGHQRNYDFKMGRRRLSDPGTATRRPLSTRAPYMKRSVTVGAAPRLNEKMGPRTQTVEFASFGIRRRRDQRRSSIGHGNTSQNLGSEFGHPTESRTGRPSNGMPASTSITRETHTTMERDLKNRGFGGFPMPFEIFRSILNRFFPKLKVKLTRTVTVPRTTSLVSNRTEAPPGVKTVPYITFDALVGRNSDFPLLTSEQLEEIGGVEYRAINALLWIIATYYIGVICIAFVVVAPYMSLSRWAPDFVPPQLHRPVNFAWFSIFQVVSAISNTGLSLVDQSMAPFQTAYPMIIMLALLILAGNTSFPVFLRFTIWILTKCTPKDSRFSETLHFLLDHPRRCYILLFPSHQTWFLLTVVLLLTVTDWFLLLVLDLGNTVLSQIPPGIRVIDAVLQAAAVRTAGFQIFSFPPLAPATKVWFVIMMYISAYPIALSVRSTNVYEERSLGIFKDSDSITDEDEFEATGPGVTVWSKYLALHARRQLAFDMWWLGLALFLVCIVERGNLDNPDNASWFTIFNILFEVVSAYGTVGLSIGIPTANYSFSGAFHTLSKLIIILVMLRGRHRGLPVAIDRAVMLPNEFPRDGNDDDDDSGEEGPEDMYHDQRRSGSQFMNGQRKEDGTEQQWRRQPSYGIVEEPIAEETRLPEKGETIN